MRKQFSVFISSTYEDLKGPYRDAARDAVLGMRFRPEMQEYFVASGNRPFDECMALVAPCDVLIVISAHRYGWVPPDQPGGGEKSVTWLECEHAEKLGKEVLAFLAAPDAEQLKEHTESHRLEVAADKDEVTAELLAEVKRNNAKLKEFKKWLEDGHMRNTFSSPDDLAKNIVKSLSAWRLKQLGESGQEQLAEDTSAYLEWVRSETGEIDIRGLGESSGKARTFPIRDLYVPLTTAALRQEEGPRDPAMRESIELQDALTHQRLVIMGDPGSGKSTFLRRIAFELAATQPDPHLLGALPDRPLPLLIRINEFAEHLKRYLDHGEQTLTEMDPVGSSRVDLQACKLEYSIVSPK